MTGCPAYRFCGRRHASSSRVIDALLPISSLSGLEFQNNLIDDSVPFWATMIGAGAAMFLRGYGIRSRARAAAKETFRFGRCALAGLRTRPSREAIDRLIYDVGMCDGADTAFYLAKGFRVLAVEANPALVKQAEQRFRHEIGSGRLTIVSCAIADRAGPIEFHVSDHEPHASSIMRERKNHVPDMETITVDAVPMADLFRRFGVPYYLKVDIEQADIIAIRGLEGSRVMPRYVSAEADLDGQIPAILRGFGYRRFKLIAQADHSRVRLPVWSREGRFVPIRFTDQHSGPFGDDISGPWTSCDQVIAQWEEVQRSGRPLWHDFHARMD